MSGPAKQLLLLWSGNSLLRGLTFGCSRLTRFRFFVSFYVLSSSRGNVARICRLIVLVLLFFFKPFKNNLGLGGMPFLKGVLANFGPLFNTRITLPLVNGIQDTVGSRFSFASSLMSLGISGSIDAVRPI